MPTLTREPPQAATQSLFLGLQSYTEAQASIFYGRDEEIDRLTNLVKINTLTIVFGKSGTGKTSLLNAGVFPRLRKDYCLPFRIRLEFGADSPDLVTQIKSVLKKEIDTYGFKVEAYPGKETLWEYFHREPLWKSITPILIFDQFEEIFTLSKKNERFGSHQLTAFWEELSDLIENNIPASLKEKFLNNKEQVGYHYKNQKVKILFAFREEYLPEFENITTKIPSIKVSRFRLMPMNGNQAYQVITKTWKNDIDAAQAHQIVGFLVDEEHREKSYDLMEIEPSLLSQVCAFIDKQRGSTHGHKISAAFLNRYPKEMILRSIYDEAMAESNNVMLSAIKDHAVGSKPVNLFVEDNLITDEGYRTRYTMKPDDETVRPGIEVLKGKYFIRDDGSSVELTHDVLTPFIKSDREERRKTLALAAARKKANKRALIIILFSVLTAAALYLIVTKKALNDKKDAQVALEKLNYKFKKDSTTFALTLKSVRDSIAKARGKGGSKGGGDNLVTGNIITEDTLRANNNDSIEIARLQNELDDIKRQKTQLQKDLDDNQTRMADDAANRAKVEASNRNDRNTIAFLQRRITEDSLQLVYLQRALNDLQKKFNDYVFHHPESIAIKRKTEAEPADTNSLKLHLFYTTPGNGKAEVPDNLKVYLIPSTKANRSIIRRAEVYEINCNNSNLDDAKGYKIAKWRDGLYTFYDVPPGNYFIKICGYYGGFYNYTKTERGNIRIDRDASPPIR